MRVVGTVLMGLGAFFVSVAAAAVLGPALRAVGIDITAQTTSVIGTALIGVFAFATGALLRRRSTDAAIVARTVADAITRPALREAAPDLSSARPPDVATPAQPPVKKPWR